MRVLAVLFLLAARRPARATTYVVDRVDDDASQTACTAADGDCTLRGAVIASNGHGGADVITLPAGTYTLSVAGAGEDLSATGDLDVRDSLTIAGADATTTIIDGGALDRVIQTDPTGGGTITVIIHDVTIRNGSAPQLSNVNAEGGGIRNGATVPTGSPAGTLHLNFSTVDGNAAAGYGGGISNDGTMTIGNCLISHNTSGFLKGGGGIVQDDEGSLDVSGTTIRDNDADANGTAAGSGGGISIGFFSVTASPTVTFEASTISGNNARTAGGLQRIRGVVTMRNVTISGNTATQSSGGAGGGIGDAGFANASQATTIVKSATITNNQAASTDGGGGINAGGAGIRVANSIVAGNTGNGTPSDVIGTLVSEGHNLIGKATGFTIDGSSDTTGDIMGVAAADLHLGPLLHESGPPTETHALLFGSPAIDAGSTDAPQAPFGCANTDQRASTRPRDGDGNGSEICDIGAYEVFDALPSPTPTATPHPGDTATLTPTPTVSATPVPGNEDCGDCLDNDGDGLVDRDDIDCDQPLDGGGQGVGDAVKAKRLVKCAGAIQKAGAKLASKRFGRLQKCLDAVFACTQSGVLPCVPKAAASCDKAFAALPGDQTKFAGVLAKACGPAVVDPADLVSAAGLGYGGHDGRCQLAGAAPVSDVDSLAVCVAAEHACRTDAALGNEVPRAAQLLSFVGHVAGELPCLADGAGSGNGLGDAARAKRAVKCQAAIKKAGAKLVTGEVKLVPKCASAVLACVQLGKKGCAEKSRATCGKTSAKVNALAAKLAATVGKACVASGLALDDVTSPGGLGFETLAATCAAARPVGFASFDDVTACLTTFHQCRAHQLLESEYPRLRELLGTGQLALP